MKSFFIFVHIPRTGGSTFSTILRKNFGDRMMDSIGNFDYNLENEGIDCVAGHTVMHQEKIKGISKWCKKYERNPIVLSFVRNPPDRIISWYLYRTKKQRKPVPFYEWLKNNHVANEQSFYLSGGPPMEMTIGVTDMFDESLEMFQTTFPDDLKNIDYGGKRHNESDPVTVELFKIQEQERNRHPFPPIGLTNDVDWALHDSAREVVQEFVRYVEAE